VIKRWLDTDVANGDFELMRLSAAMAAANPNLAALTASHVVTAAAAGSARMARDLGVSPEHPAVVICNAALGEALGTYIRLLVSSDLDNDICSWFLDFLAAIFEAARLAAR